MGRGLLLTDAAHRPASEGIINPGEELRAAAATVLAGALTALGEERLGVHGYDDATLLTVEQLADLWRPGNVAAQLGLAFELAVQRAFVRGSEDEYERLTEALHAVGFGEVREPQAFLFGPEKAGRLEIVEAAYNALTGSSRAFKPGRGNRMLLRDRLGDLVLAHRTQGRGGNLPYGYRELWKADLFLGCRERDLWAGISCKATRAEVEPVGDCIPFAVAPGTPKGHADKRPFTFLRQMPTVSFPRKGVVWSYLARAQGAMARYMKSDGHLDKIDRDVADDLYEILKELHFRRRERAVQVIQDWLTRAEADTSEIWTPRQGTPLAA